MKRLILLLLVVFALGACTPVPVSVWGPYTDGATLTRLQQP